jgi:hypothetical protein
MAESTILRATRPGHLRQPIEYCSPDSMVGKRGKLNSAGDVEISRGLRQSQFSVSDKILKLDADRDRSSYFGCQRMNEALASIN